jgi:hypothetical protein
MNNEQFHSDIDKMFESYLSVERKPMIRIAKDGIILTSMPYHKVLFDSELNIYKKNEDGTLELVTDPHFKAVVVTSEQ